MSLRRSWYHCSQLHREQSWTAERRAPQIRASSEPDTPRLCVAGSVAQALAAVWWTRDVSVYVTEPRRTVPPAGVFDACMTGERWIVPPVRLHLLCVIPFAAIDQAQAGLEPWEGRDGDERWHKRTLKFRNMCEIVRVHVPSAQERWVERFAEKCVRLFASRLEAA